MRSGKDHYGIFLCPSGEVFIGQSSPSNPSVDFSQRLRSSSITSAPAHDSSSRSPGLPGVPRTIYWHSPMHRQGWGVWLHKTERYEGEWENDARHGIGCINNRSGERYAGQFENGCKSGKGICISSTGELYAELWDSGQSIKRSLVFEDAGEDLSAGKVCDCLKQVSDSRQRAHAACALDGQEAVSTRYPTTPIAGSETVVLAERGGSANENVKRSNAKSMELWTVEDVAVLLSAIGFDPRSVAQLRAHRVSGNVLGTLVSSAAVPFLESTFGKHQPNPECRLLVLVVELLLKFKQKLSSAHVSNDELMRRFGHLELGDGELSFDGGRTIGEGGYAIVYKARWMHTDVAAKVLRSNDESRLIKELYSELNVLHTLRHPNITLLIGFCFRPSCLIVTEFVDGGSLFSLLHGSKALLDWSLSKVMSIARDICLGMVYLHANRIVHCDLKSSNVLLSKTLEVKLCDFGLAHLLGETVLQEQLSINIGAVGTHQWMAPEVLKGEGYSKAADVYSFGMIFWEMISRQVPFQGYSAPQIIALVGYGHRQPRLPDDCPEPLREILQKALRPSPQARKSFKDLAEDLARLHRSFIIDVEESLWTFFLG